MEQRGDRGPTILAEPAVENQSRVDRTELWRRTGVANAFKEIPRQHRPAVSGRDPALFQMQEGDRVKIGRQFRTSFADGRSTGRHERAPVVRELCGNAFQKTPVATERRARGGASFCGFCWQESVAVGAGRGLITQRSLVQIQPPQP